MPIRATLFTDPGCPWAYSASPALAVLRWRYADGIDWRLVMIGLAEERAQYERRGYRPETQARGYRRFREGFGMPFAAAPRTRMLATGPACRAIVAARLHRPGAEWDVLRALQLAWFTSSALLDEPKELARALGATAIPDAAEILAASAAPATEAAYQQDLELTRSAAGSATDWQGKAAATDGPVRYTAPSVIFEADDGRALEAGGFQPLEAYDVLLANLDRSLVRRAPPADPLPALRHFPAGLVTQEVAAILAGNLERVDREGAEDTLIDLAAAGHAQRVPLGDDALWLAP